MAKKRPKKTPAPQESPTCNCIMLCDDVLVSTGKHKHTLAGVIGWIAVQEFPATIGGYVAYIRISNVYGTQSVTVSLEDPNDSTLLEFRADLVGDRGPLDVHTLVVPIPPFAVKKPGRYVFLAKDRDGLLLAMVPIQIQSPASIAERE